jgi:stage III sporulation protein AG
MEIEKITLKIRQILKKYKYALIILILGIILMMLPDKTEIQTTDSVSTTSAQKSLDEELTHILSLIDGAGEVQVLLTKEIGEETIYQTDEDTSVQADSSSIKVKTIILTTADKAQTGLIKQVNPPKYLGAIVLCQGADRPSVCLAITEAVSKITGLGANNISVLKMK